MRAPPPAEHEWVVGKWLAWLETIRKHVLDLHHHREIWRTLCDAILHEAGDSPAVFLVHYTRLYVDGQVMAVRRLVDPNDKESLSLGRLIKDIRSQPEVMTRERYVALHDGEWAGELWEGFPAKDFDEYWGDGSGALDPVKVAADLNRLVELSAAVRKFATKTVAHIDKKGVDELPTLVDLDNAIEVLGDMFRRYALLLTGASWPELAPVIQGDWRATFRRPLFEPQ